MEKKNLETQKIAAKAKQLRNLELQAIREMSPAPKVTVLTGVALE